MPAGPPPAMQQRVSMASLISGELQQVPQGS
jgi:hypothetical protein